MIDNLDCNCIPLGNEGIDPPSDKLPEPTWINVNGRAEHEALLKDAVKMESLGLDPHFELMVYLKRWGGFLHEG